MNTYNQTEKNESQNRAIDLLEKLGYDFISINECEVSRKYEESHRNVLLYDSLNEFLRTQTYEYEGVKRHFSDDSISAAISALEPRVPDLYTKNKTIYDLLCGGKSLEESLPNGTKQSFDINYIDFDHVENNIFQVTEEFSVEGNDQRNVRPDIILFINGIPLVVIECKKSAVSALEGVNQNIRNWGPNYIPHLFQYAQVVIAVNPNELLYGTCGTPSKYFVPWKEEGTDYINFLKKASKDGEVIEQDKGLYSLTEPKRLLNLIKHFIIYDNKVKKIARYKQFFAVNKSMERILGKDDANTRNGVIWHTQGSGKSLTMVMLAKMLISYSKKSDSQIKNPRFIMVTDRVNLDKQICDNFNKTSMSPTKATTGAGLGELLKDKSVTIITTIVNKFETAMKKGNTFTDDNLFVFIDEGHRTQYGSFNMYMEKTLPNAVKIAFTGTPLMAKGKDGIVPARDTFKKFGPLIDSYTFLDAINDKVTVPIVYEGRVVPQEVTNNSINTHLKHITVGLSEEAKRDLEKKYSSYMSVSQSDQRLNMLAFDIHEHFTSYIKPKKFKAILTCASRYIAVQMYYKLKKLGNMNPYVVITPNSNFEGENEENTRETLKAIDDFFSTEIDTLYKNNYDAYENMVTENFADPDGDIDFLIVKDKLLTGYDAPPCGVLYVDKKLQDHNLLQAIARVNRVYDNKDFGLIVDYIGIFKKLKSAMDLYSAESLSDFDNTELQGAIISIEEQKRNLEALHEKLFTYFPGISKNETRMNVLQEALEEKGTRLEFYEDLSQYAKYVDLLFASLDIYEEVGEKKALEYKRDYEFFRNLKNSVSLRYNDSVSFSKYEDGIRQLINTFVTADNVKIQIEPLDISNKDRMEEQLKIFGGDKVAKADAIRTRQTEAIESCIYEDPIKYMTFRERIDKTLKDYMKERDAEKYLTEIQTIADDYRNGVSYGSYPSNITNDSSAKSFYGAICKGLNKSNIDAKKYEDENTGNLSISIKDVVTRNAKKDWRDNVTVHNKIRSELDDVLFDYIEANCLEWSLDIIDKIIDEVLLAAKRLY